MGCEQGRDEHREARRELLEAASAMRDPLSQDFADGLQPANLVTLAATPFGRILYIVSTEHDRRIRIISARDATRHERRRYEEAR